MSQAIRQLIAELRKGAEMEPEGGRSMPWRIRIGELKAISVTQHGLGLSLLWSASRTLLLQRGQIGTQGDEELRGVLVALANILELELAAQETATANRSTSRGAVPYYLKDSA